MEGRGEVKRKGASGEETGGIACKGRVAEKKAKGWKALGDSLEVRGNFCSGRVKEEERYQENGKGRDLSEGRRVEREVNWEEREKDCAESMEVSHWERREAERNSGFYGNGQGRRSRDLEKS